MKIVILGAGISGCAVYLQLRKHLPKPSSGGEHSITIYEAYDTGRDTTHTDRVQDQDIGGSATHSSTLIVGGGLGVGANGLNVLKRLDEDLLRDFVRGGYVVQKWNMKSKDGSVLARISGTGSSTHSSSKGSAKNAANEDGEMGMVGTSRHNLWRCLRLRVPDSDIVTKRVAGVVARPDGLNVVSFVDGSPSVEADLVIGADGLKSTAKLALFPEAKEDPYPPNYEGLVGVGGFIPASSVLNEVELGSMNFVFGGNGFFGYFYADSSPSAPHRDSPYHVSAPGSQLAWWSTYAVGPECPTPKTLDMMAVTRQLRERHGSWKDPVIQKVLNQLKVDNMWPTWTVPALPKWHRDGVVLVGDAAHALPPTSGQGSSQALEDCEAFALFLAHQIQIAEGAIVGDESVTHQKKTITKAAQQYEDLRKPHVAAIMKEAQKMQSNKRDMGFLQERLMYGFMWLLGSFPSLMEKKLGTVARYNVAEAVAQVLEKGE